MESFQEFWSYYVGEHRHRMCRVLHYLGTLAAVAVAAWSCWSCVWLGLVLAPVVGYAFAWIGHLCVEHNHPATWGYPGWSLRADFKMVGLALSGRMGRELARVSGHRERS